MKFREVFNIINTKLFQKTYIFYFRTGMSGKFVQKLFHVSEYTYSRAFRQAEQHRAELSAQTNLKFGLFDVKSI